MYFMPHLCFTYASVSIAQHAPSTPSTRRVLGVLGISFVISIVVLRVLRVLGEEYSARGSTRSTRHFLCNLHCDAPSTPSTRRALRVRGVLGISFVIYIMMLRVLRVLGEVLAEEYSTRGSTRSTPHFLRNLHCDAPSTPSMKTPPRGGVFTKQPRPGAGLFPNNPAPRQICLVRTKKLYSPKSRGARRDIRCFTIN